MASMPSVANQRWNRRFLTEIRLPYLYLRRNVDAGALLTNE
jgi:hypothetical protein